MVSDSSVQINNDPPPSSGSNGRGLDLHERIATGSGTVQHDRDKMQSSTQGAVPVRYANLPPLIMFSGKGQDDGKKGVANCISMYSRKVEQMGQTAIIQTPFD